MDFQEMVYQRKKKRKREEITTNCNRKLLVGEKVEVRSVDGSWNLAIVIGHDNFAHHVRYEHVLDDGPAKLTQLIEGVIFHDKSPKYNRGSIRPMPPPPFVIHKWVLHYGLCVDAYLNEAWWEGVIFDYEDGFEERLIFFPDMDDQKTISVDQLRITQDWNEVSGQWTSRKNWLFLELLEEHMQGTLVDVSVRQVWQILRSKKEFEERNIDWTCGERSLWDVMVTEVIRDMKLTAEHVPDGVNLVEGSKEMRNETNGVVSKGQEEETQTLFASAEFDGNVLLKPESDVITLIEVEEDSIPQLILQNEENCSVSELPSCQDSCALTLTGNDGPLNDLGMKDYNSWNNILNFSRYILDTEVLPTDPNPTPVSTMGDKELDNLNGSRDDDGEFIQPRALSGLPSNGDKFSCISSDVGQEVEIHEAGGAVLDAAKNHGCSNDLSSSGALGNFSLSDEARGIGVRDNTNGLRNGDDPTPRRKGTWLPIVGPEKLPGGTEYCPDALINCLQSRSHRRKSEDNNHYSALLGTRFNLLNVGWKIELKKDETKIQRFRYISPDGRQTMYSLRKVSKYLTENRAKIQSQSPQNGHQSPVNVNVTDELLVSNVEEDVERQQRKVVPINVASPSCSETPALDLPKRDVKPKDSASEVEVIAAEYCPQAVIDWYNVASDGRRPKGAAASLLIFRAKKHLLAVGWNFWYTQKRTRQELRYTSPKGKNYTSLVTACKAYIEEGEFLGNMGPIHGQYEKGVIESYGSSQSRELPEFDNVQVNNSFPLAFNLNQSQTNALSQSSQDEKRLALGHNATSQQPEKRKAFGALVKQLDGNKQTRVMRSSKRVRQIVVASPMHQTPRTILSCLIDNNVVLPRAKVYYKGRNDHHKLAEGRITRGGIRCNCCHKVFGLTKFEAHTGITSCQPAANIFLEDGRSLLQCQKQMLNDNKANKFALESRERIKRNWPCNKTDDICSICYYGGKLLLCDQCPSAFHLSCLGLKALPEGRWFCPSCRCGICDQSEFNGDTQRFTGKTILYCDQCEREYHVGCIRQRGATELESCPKGNWFCSEKCEEIFVGLHKLLGKPISVGVDNLSWTILKASKDDYHNLVASESETRVEHHNKLNVALGVMHESFKPIKERYTKIDLIENVLFNKWSELNRLNFWGFYTVLLERDEELISVATVRVYGEKVAEVPLVATRFQYRCRGMCRILMDFLERKLAEFGVERLILPAVPQVLRTWTTSFGFSKMTRKERLEFLKYTFLDFQGTTMCQKILKMTSTRTSMELTGNRNILGDVLDQSDEKNEMDMSSVASGVTQEEEEIEQCQVVEQIPIKKSRKMFDDPDWIPGQW